MDSMSSDNSSNSLKRPASPSFLRRDTKAIVTAAGKGNLADELRSIQKQLAAKEETLRTLRMVKIYRTKNDLTELEEIIQKWRQGCQEALECLLDVLNRDGNELSMESLLQRLGLETEMVGWDSQSETFQD